MATWGKYMQPEELSDRTQLFILIGYALGIVGSVAMLYWISSRPLAPVRMPERYVDLSTCDCGFVPAAVAFGLALLFSLFAVRGAKGKSRR